MDNNNRILEVSDGRTASMYLAWAAPLFDQVEKDLLNSLKSNFRAGSYSELLLACHVAQLCAIDDIKTKMKGIAIRGESAAVDMSNEDDGDHE